MGIGDFDSLLDGRLPPLDWRKAAFTAQAAFSYHSSLYLAGEPGAGAVASSGVNGNQVLNGRSGTLLAPAAQVGKSCELIMADFSAESNLANAFLADRLWENSGLSVTSTSAQAIAAQDLPPRDRNSTSNGAGVMAALEITTTMGAATATATITYTDSDGNAGVTAQVTIPSGCVAGTLLLFPTPTGKYGVRKITSFQLSGSMVSGAFSLVLYTRLGRKLRGSNTNPPDSYGPADGGHPIPDGCAPWFIYQVSNTAVGASTGTVQFGQA